MRIPFANKREIFFRWYSKSLLIFAVVLFFLEVSLKDGSISFIKFLQSRSGTIHRRLAGSNTTESCLDPNGPQPFILMSLGRSGSGVTIRTLTTLTGLETPADEYTGSTPLKSRKFFNLIKNDQGLWVTDKLCKKQQQYPAAKLVGFKWKPWKSIYSEPALDGLNCIAESQDPTIKVVRLRRNLLDVRLSTLKHRHSNMKKGHCKKGDEKCLRKHLQAGSNITVPIDDMVAYLETMTRDEDHVDALLDDMNVSHVHVTYERLYRQNNTEEWMKIFRFLGVGPTEGLTMAQVRNAMGMEPTSHAHHRDTVFNYDELKGALAGTVFEHLLH